MPNVAHGLVVCREPHAALPGPGQPSECGSRVAVFTLPARSGDPSVAGPRGRLYMVVQKAPARAAIHLEDDTRPAALRRSVSQIRIYQKRFSFHPE